MNDKDTKRVLEILSVGNFEVINKNGKTVKDALDDKVASVEKAAEKAERQALNSRKEIDKKAHTNRALNLFTLVEEIEDLVGKAGPELDNQDIIETSGNKPDKFVEGVTIHNLKPGAILILKSGHRAIYLGATVARATTRFVGGYKMVLKYTNRTDHTFCTKRISENFLLKVIGQATPQELDKANVSLKDRNNSITLLNQTNRIINSIAKNSK